MDIESQKRLLDRSQEANDRYRDRAKSLANLTGAAAGALAAGLVLSPSTALTSHARVLGLVAILLLLTATALFAMAHAVRGVIRRNHFVTGFSYVFRPWIAFQDAGTHEGESEQISYLQSSSDAILRRMARLSDIAMMVSGGAIVFLVLALWSAGVDVPRPESVTVYASERIRVPGCGLLPKSFDGTLRSVTDEMVEIQLAPGACALAPDRPLWVTFDRREITLEPRD